MTITTLNPATEEEIESYTLMTEQEATDRIEACHAAFLEWRKLTHQERAPYLTKIGRTLREHADELAALMTRETGKLLKDGHTEVEICAAICDYTAQHGPEVLADEDRSHGAEGKRGVVSYRPIGVIYVSLRCGPRSGGLDVGGFLICGPVPGEETVEARDWRFGDAGDDVCEPGLRVDVVQPGGDDQSVHEGGAVAAAV